MEVRLSEQQAIVELAKKHFRVRDYYVRDDGSVEVLVEPEPDSKYRFAEFFRVAKTRGWMAALRGGDGSHTLLVGKRISAVSLNPLVPFILFSVTLAAVFADEWLRSRSLLPASLYAGSLMGILLVHEMGHKLASHLYRSRSSPPYFIPGIPGFFPTFGAVIFSMEPTLNRDALFDIGLTGPVAGLVFTILVAVPGAILAPSTPGALVPAPEAEELISRGLGFRVGTSLLQILVLDNFVPNGFVLRLDRAPLAYAAWLGFLITFLNLMPATQLDGGHMARAVLGRRLHRIATLASVILLAALQYWPMALLILLLSARTPDVRPLDDVSPLSKSRKVLFPASLLLGALCAPIIR